MFTSCRTPSCRHRASPCVSAAFPAHSGCPWSAGRGTSWDRPKPSSSGGLQSWVLVFILNSQIYLVSLLIFFSIRFVYSVFLLEYFHVCHGFDFVDEIFQLTRPNAGQLKDISYLFLSCDTSTMGLVILLLSYVGILTHILFVTISFAAGLYYISEIVEEYSEKCKKIIKISTISTIVLYLLLAVSESFSWTMILCGLSAQLVHLAILRNFPNIKILSLEFWWVVLILIEDDLGVL